MRLAVLAKNAEADAFAGLLDGGYIEFRSGTLPATPETAATGSLLLSFNLENPAFTAAVNGVADLDLPAVQLITATGTVAWARLFTSGDVVVCDATVGTSGTDIIVDSVSFTLNEGFALSAMDYTQAMETV